MSRIIKFVKVLRRNWKKSIFFSGVLAYGASYGIEKYQTLQMMRAYCEEAKVYGEQVLNGQDRPRHITVLLNPEANDKKSSISYEKFAAPLFHLAGFKVSLFKTEGGSQARDLMTIMENTDAVVIAGGNGTFHEAVTGLLNRSEKEEETNVLPIGVVPVGKTNTVANHLFSSKASSKPQLLAESAMAVIRETTVSLDVMKIQKEGEEKPLFAMSSFEAGVFADLDDIVHKYWYWGPLKDKYLYFKNSFKKINPFEDYDLDYVSPCSGCSRCYKETKRLKTSGNHERWWHAFIPRASSNKKSEPTVDYSKIVNDACGTVHKLHNPFANISISSSAIQPTRQPQVESLWVKVHPEKLSFTQFISSGLSHQKTKTTDPLSLCEVVEAGHISVNCHKEEEESDDQQEDSASERYCFIDKEKYKMGSYQITLLPKRLLVYGLPE